MKPSYKTNTHSSLFDTTRSQGAQSTSLVRMFLLMILLAAPVRQCFSQTGTGPTTVVPGQSSSLAQAIRGRDPRPPGPAPMLTGTAPSPTVVTLQWQPVAGSLGYLVYRDNKSLTQYPIKGTSFNVPARPKATYLFTVAAVFAPAPQGQYSPGISPPVSVVTPPALPPASLTATRTGPSTIRASWTPRLDAVAYVLFSSGAATRRINSTTITDQGLAPDSYVYQVAAVYQAEGGAEFVSERSPLVEVDIRPFNVVVIGDSIMWGQGLSGPSKFSTKVRQWVESQLTGRPVQLTVLAHSGAVIGFALDPNDERKVTEGEVPNDFPTIAYQGAHLPVRPEAVDLVLMDGCINDTNVKSILTPDPTVGPDWVRKIAREHCGDAARGLLSVALDDNWFPYAKVVVTGYYPIVSEQSDLRAVTNLLSALGLLDPDPTFVTQEMLFAFVSTLKDKLAAQSKAWYEQSTSSLREVVSLTNIHYGTNRIRFADLPFRPENSYAAPNSWLWLVGQHDEVWNQRQAQCGYYPPDYHIPPYCSDAAMGHPNLTGAQAYADAIIRELQPFVSEWRMRGGPSTTVSSPQHPPLYVLAEYGQRTPTQANMTVFTADWATGAGVPGQVKLDGALRGAVGQSICITMRPTPVGGQRNPWYGGLIPPTGSVIANGYSETAFNVQPPVLTLKVQVNETGQTPMNVDGDPDEKGVRTGLATVNAIEATTGTTVDGDLYLNGVKIGKTGQQFTYSCHVPLPLRDIETSSDDKTSTGKPKKSPVRSSSLTIRYKPPLCRGVVQATGYDDALFSL